MVTSIQPDQVRRVGVVGAGVIGGGWALHYLRMGMDVDVYDPAPDAQGDLLRMLEVTWPLLVIHGSDDEWVGADQGRMLYERAKQPRRYAEIEGANHAFAWHRAALLKEISGWLAEIDVLAPAWAGGGGPDKIDALGGAP